MKLGGSVQLFVKRNESVYSCLPYAYNIQSIRLKSNGYRRSIVIETLYNLLLLTNK